MQLFSKKDLLGLGFVLIFSILMIKGTFAAQDCITVADGNWSDPLIWSDCTGVGGLPDTGESVVIYNNVTVDTNIEVAAITISSGTFDMGSYTVTLNGTNDILNLLNNSEGSVVPGTSTLIITAQGASHNVTVGVSELNNISLNPVVIDEPIYTLNNVALTLSGNLVINPSGSTKGLSVVLGDALTVNGTEGIDLTSTTVDPSTFRLYNYTLNAYSINIGTNNTLQADASDIMVSHDWVNNGNFVRGSSTVFFTGSNPHTISGSTSFAGLNITNPNIGIPVTVTFDEGALTDVKTGLTLQGTSNGGRIKLRSSNPGSQWFFEESSGVYSVDTVDVKDGGCSISSGNIDTTNSIDSGNNDACWSALGSYSNNVPDDPSGLTPNDGTTYTTSNNITFNFTISDTDNDYLSYHIQIDDDDDFSSPVVDYTSTFLNPGDAPYFQVGQALNDGTYTVGSVGQTLDNGSYYWRMKTIDPYDGESNWVEADDFDLGIVEDFIVYNSAPAEPSNLGPSNYVDGSVGFDLDPELQFNVGADPEDDPKGFRIQIDDTSDFSSPVVDYTSNLTDTKTDGPFTVGEDPSVHLGSYTAGSVGQTLDPGSYYWQVQSIDVYNHASGWNTANSGSVAFIISAGNSNPDNPTNLGPSNLVDGSKTTDNTPTLTFDLSDPDVANTVRFLIQIDNDSDFSSPTVGYVSDLLAQGSTSFTVGQVDGGGSYTYSSSGQTLSDGSYYWEVLTRDEYDVDSGWTIANSGAVAFIVDTTAPTISEVTPVATPTSDTTPNYTFTTNEAGDISYGGDCTSATSSASSGSNTITFSSLANGAHTNCTIVVTDTVGNASNTLTVTSFTIDTVAPTISEVTPVTTPTNDTTPNYTFTTNEAGTISYGGDCTSATTSASSGSNTITFSALSAGAHTNCTIIVTDTGSNASNTLSVTSFTIDTTAPTISEVTPVATPTTDTTPDYIFTTDEAGDISYGGDCTSQTASASLGSNTITFDALSEGAHTNCTIVVTDTAGNASNTLTVTSFTINASSPNNHSPSTLTGGSSIANFYQNNVINNPVPENENSNPGGPSVVELITKNLKFNIIDLEVKILQKYLNNHGFPLAGPGDYGAGSPGKETNYFGNKTLEAVKKLQKAKNLIIDGIVGPQTREYINTHN